MTEVAGEVADGFMIHPFSTEKFMRETTMPALERGLATSGRNALRARDRVPGDGDRRRDRRGARRRAATRCARASRSTARRPRTRSCSTRTVGATCSPSSTACRRPATGRRMASMITDEIVDTFVVSGTPRRDRPADAGPLRRHRATDVVRLVGTAHARAHRRGVGNVQITTCCAFATISARSVGRMYPAATSSSVDFVNASTYAAFDGYNARSCAAENGFVLPMSSQLTLE